MTALIATAGLLAAALATAATLTWQRHAARPVRVGARGEVRGETKLEGTTFYPRVKR